MFRLEKVSFVCVISFRGDGKFDTTFDFLPPSTFTLGINYTTLPTCVIVCKDRVLNLSKK